MPKILRHAALLMAAAAVPAALAACPLAEPAPLEEAACTLADRLEADFVYPEQGALYARTLRTNVEAGRYRAASGEEGAKLVTADLQAAAPDGHLHMAYQPDLDPEGPPPSSQRRGSVIERAGWIAPGVAFIRFNGFPDDRSVAEAAGLFMAEHADADALIFDLRTNGGGGVAQMDAIFPWLFATDTPLLRMATRRSIEERLGSPVEGIATMQLVPETGDLVVREHHALPNGHAELVDTPVYVLTGPRTASAAEHFTLAMKATGRGTIIGAPTAGANHFGGTEFLGGGYTAFLPVGRSYDIATGKDWEGDGIAPDIAVAVEDALARALVESGVAADEAARLSAEWAPELPLVRRAQ